jgi:hypothetical protein
MKSMGIIPLVMLNGRCKLDFFANVRNNGGSV